MEDIMNMVYLFMEECSEHVYYRDISSHKVVLCDKCDMTKGLVCRLSSVVAPRSDTTNVLIV